MKQIFKKLPNILLIFCTALFMLSMVQLPAKAAPSYYITNGGSGFQVSGGSSYSTLTDALSACPGDGSQVIQLGTAAGTPLEVAEVSSPAIGSNALVNATYTGWLKIVDDPSLSGVGLSARGKFDGLTITTTVNTDNFTAMRIPGGGALEITGSASITIGKGTCIINEGTLSISGGTLSVNASNSTVIVNNSSLTMTGGSLSGAADQTVCLVNQTGTATISGGTITASNPGSASIDNQSNLTISETIPGNTQISATSYAIANRVTAVLSISGGTIESTETGGKAISVENGTVNMSGGTVRAASSSNGVCNGIKCFDGQVNISGGEVSCSSTHNSASAVYVMSDNTSAAVNIYGTANITGVSYGVFSSGKKTTGTGAVYIHGGTVSATGVSGTAIINQNIGLITIAAGTIESAAGDGVINEQTGTIKITGGSVSGGNNGIYASNGGLIDISGGTVASTGASGTGINVRPNFNNQINVVLSSNASIVSASANTIWLSKLSGTHLETTDLFGKIIHGSTTGVIGIKGINSGSGTYIINSLNCSSAVLTASSINAPSVFLGWASNAPLTAIISTANGAMISNLTTGANAGVTNIYLKAGVPVAVFLASGSLGTAGDEMITDLTSGTYYQVTLNSNIYYVRADGTMTPNVSQSAALTGTVITGLTNGSTYKVEVYTPSVILAAGSMGTAGNAKITGLTSGVKYKILSSAGTCYVTANGTVSNSAADLAELIGTEITGLPNGKTYKVEVYTPSVLLGSGSLGTAGDRKITGLTSGARYMLARGTGAYYIKADGTLSPTVADLADLTGTEITGLTNDTVYYVIPYTYMARVFVTDDSPGTADDTKITGLTSGSKYQVTVGSTVYYVKADGTLSTNIADLIELTGTEITGLANETTYKVEVYSPPAASVTLDSGSLGTAGNSKITGLVAGTKYQVTTGSVVYYVKADGTLSAALAEMGELAGTEVTGLVNGTTYKVEVYSSLLSAPANLSATRGSGRVFLSWDPVTGAVGYSVYQSTISGSYGSALDSVSETVYAVTGLTNGTPYYFKVKAYNAAGDSAFSNEATAIPARGGGDSDESSSNSASPLAPSGTPGANILVNGQSQNAGTVVTSQQGGQTVTTVVVDQQKLEQKLASEGNNAVVTIPVNSQSDKTIGELNGQMVKNMEAKEAVVELKTPSVTYTLPAQQINIEAISNQLGQNVELKDIKVQIEISKPTAQEAQVVENTAQKGEFSIVIPPVQFSVKCTYNNQTIEVTNFNNYVERTIAIPDGVDPNKITTGVVFEPDGAVRHVPTQVIKIDGKYYAKINSVTNSTYSVIWNPIEFKDVADHWARTAINDMGSRMVVSGVGNGTFEPDRGITRAEFAAIMVKALGLKPGTGSNPFADVKASEWYTDYIKTAYEYKIISGYSAAAFGPGDGITREQAMTMIAKAMKITNLKVELGADELEKLLVKYSDSVQTAEWGRESMAACVKAGIVSGKSANIIGPRDEITRAEVAVMVRQLLQKSVLI